MVIGVVVLHADGNLLHDLGHGVGIERGLEPRQVGETRLQFFESGAQYIQFGGVDHASVRFRQGGELTAKSAVPAR
jgi:hypothetical protein